MRTTVYCCRCGGPRTYVRGATYRGGQHLVCFRCGHDVFTTNRYRAPIFPVTVLFTAEDRYFLRSLGIATTGTAAARSVQP